MLGIYARLSREDDASNSIENQIREGKVFAGNNGFDSYELYNEGEGVSGGADIKDRPELFRLMQDMSSGKIKAVWFRHQNRLERNSTTFAIFTGDAKKKDVKLFFGDKQYDYNDPSNVMFGGITSYISQYQKDLQSAQTKRTLLANAAEGKVWSIVAYGYQSNNGYLEINKKEAEVVKRIYSESLEGKGTDSIAVGLNIDNIPTRRGAKWRGRTVRGIIKNSLYKGERIYSGKVFASPVIIDPELWQRVNDNLPNNRNNSGKKVEHKYMLKGLLKCGCCGKGYYGKVKYKNEVINENTYTCVGKRYKEINCGNRSINRPALDTLIWMEFFLNGEFEKALREHIDNGNNSEHRKKLQVKIANIDRLLKAEDKKLENIANAIINGIEINGKLQDKTEKIKAEIDRYKREKSKLKEKLGSVEVDLTKLNDAKVRNELNTETRNAVLKQYIDKIEILYKEPNYFVRIWFAVDGMEPKVYGIHKNYYLDKSYNTLQRSGELVHYFTLELGLGEGLMLLKGAKNYVEDWN